MRHPLLNAVSDTSVFDAMEYVRDCLLDPEKPRYTPAVARVDAAHLFGVLGRDLDALEDYAYAIYEVAHVSA